MKWEEELLGNVADCVLGKMLDKRKNRGDQLPYLANINVRWGNFEFDGLREMRFQSHEFERFGLKEGDIVMCEGGVPGRCAIWKNQIPNMMFQKAIHRIRPHDSLNYQFLFYIFLQKGSQNGFDGFFTGSTIKHLTAKNLKKVPVRFPPLPTQQRIASILSAYDDLIENNRRRIHLLEESARLLYREWFVHLRFPGHENTTIKNGVPEGWAFTTLNEIAPQVRKAVHPTTLDPDSLYIGLEHISRCSITLVQQGRAGDVDSGKFAFEENDILFGKIRPYFHKVAFAGQAGIASSDAVILRPPSKELWAYAMILVSSSGFVEYASKTVREGSKMPRADWNFLAQTEQLLPPTSLLKNLGDFVLPLVQELKILAQQNTQLARARDLLLPKLMSGEIEV